MEDKNLTYKNLWSQKGFRAYILAEFLAVLTDNIYKMTLAFLALYFFAEGLDEKAKIPIISGVFVLPFLLFVGWGGYLADRYSKKRVLIVSKMSEFFILFLVCFSLYSRDFYFTLVTLFIIMTKSAFMLPAKDGIIAEITSPHQLSRANGLVQMGNFIGTIIGMMIAGIFSSVWKENTLPISYVLVTFGALGWWSSYFITDTNPRKSLENFPWNPWHDIGQGIKKLKKSLVLRTSFYGSFWFSITAALFYTNILILGKQSLVIQDFFGVQSFFAIYFNYPNVDIIDFYTALLPACLAIGLGSGSAMAGFLSGDKVELGLMPLGALGIGFGSILVYFVAPNYFYTAPALTFIGFFGGFFIIPLKSFIQSRSSEGNRGRIMATQNFFDTCGALAGFGIYYLLNGVFNWSSTEIFLISGISTLLVGLYIIKLMPLFLIRFVLWCLVNAFYRIRVIGRENVPLNGPALLVANHVSYIDGILVSACISKSIRFLIYGELFKIRFLNWLFKKLKSIPVRSGKDLAKSIERARNTLLKNEIVCIFAEGQLTHTGNMLPFKRGFEKIVENIPKDIPIVPIYLDGLWWSIFSFEKGKYFFKIPSWKRLDITICFGEHLPASTKKWELRQTIAELGAKAAEGRRKNDIPLGMQLIEIARLYWFKEILGDWSRKSISYGRLIIRSLTLASYLRKNVQDERVAIYLEDNLQKAIVNIALNFSGKTAVNLNFHESLGSLKDKLKRVDTHTVITTKSESHHFENSIVLEKIPKVTSRVKAFFSGVLFLLLPAKFSFWLLCNRHFSPSRPVLILFKDDGTPLVFSNSNILSQTQSLNHIFFNGPSGLLFASLPFDTIDGLILGLWLPLFSRLHVVYGQEKDITGEVIQDLQVTFIIGSSTSYKKLFLEATPSQIKSLRYAIVLDGGMNVDEMKAFQDKFGIEILEGFSVPELAGFVSLNHKNYIESGIAQIANKWGTVGQSIPGTCAKILESETLKPMLPGEKGVLFVKSSGRAQGESEWYNTKLLASMDDAGFIILER